MADIARLERLAPSAAKPEIKAVLLANAANKSAGKQLLRELPLWQRLAARARSWFLLLIMYATFWPSLIGTVAVTLIWKVLGYSSSSRVASKQRLYSSPKQGQALITMNGHHNGHQNGHHNGHHNGHQQSALTIMNGYHNGHHVGQQLTGTAAAAVSPGGFQDVPGTALVTGGKMTKALHVCRHLHAAGWRVLLLETHKYWHVGSRFSNAVDKFYTVPVPEDHPAEYVEEILSIAALEAVNLFIPVSSPISSVYDALAAEALDAHAAKAGRHIRCWTLSPSTTATLDNKALFSDYARSLGLTVPDHHVVTSPQQLMKLNSPQVLGPKTFVLKNLSYDSVHRADMVKLPCTHGQLVAYVRRADVIISQQQPWILQEFIQGKEYSCYSLASNGHLVAHSDTLAGLSNLNYSHQGHPGIQQWVTEFVRGSNASGQLCFDFLESDVDGRLYCIECNPRTSSVITEFHDNRQLATAFSRPEQIDQPVLPLSGSPATYWWWNEVARLVTNPGYLPQFIRVIRGGVDAVYSPADPLPFLGSHYLQIPVLLMGNIVRGNPWKKIDLCIGKIAELYGD